MLNRGIFTGSGKVIPPGSPLIAAALEDFVCLRGKIPSTPFYASEDLPVLRILTDRGTGYCGKADSHDYQLYLAINDIEHARTKARHPQSNGICERFHKTILQEFYQPALRRKIFGSVEELKADLDIRLDYYNNERTHQGKRCCGRTPMEALLDGKKVWKEKFVN